MTDVAPQNQFTSFSAVAAARQKGGLPDSDSSRLHCIARPKEGAISCIACVCEPEGKSLASKPAEWENSRDAMAQSAAVASRAAVQLSVAAAQSASSSFKGTALPVVPKFTSCARKSVIVRAAADKPAKVRLSHRAGSCYQGC